MGRRARTRTVVAIAEHGVRVAIQVRRSTTRSTSRSPSRRRTAGCGLRSARRRRRRAPVHLRWAVGYSIRTAAPPPRPAVSGSRSHANAEHRSCARPDGQPGHRRGQQCPGRSAIAGCRPAQQRRAAHARGHGRHRGPPATRCQRPARHWCGAADIPAVQPMVLTAAGIGPGIPPDPFPGSCGGSPALAPRGRWPPRTTVRAGHRQAWHDARQDCTDSACWDGSPAGAPPGGGSGPRRSSVPQMTAPAAKMPVHHQNTVV